MGERNDKNNIGSNRLRIRVFTLCFEDIGKEKEIQKSIGCDAAWFENK